MGVSPLPYSFKHWLLTEAIRRPRPAVPIPHSHTQAASWSTLCVHLFGQPPASVHTPAPPDPAGRSRARRRPARARARRARPPTPHGSAGCRRRGCRLLASTPPLAAARSGPMRHRRSRPIDPSRYAVGSEAHGTPSRACFARSARVVPLVPMLLR